MRCAPGRSTIIVLLKLPFQCWHAGSLMPAQPRLCSILLAFTTPIFVSNAANPAGIGFDAAAGSISNFQAAEGLSVSLFAAEPMVRNPTDMDIDERGRVWITEGINYRSSF